MFKIQRYLKVAVLPLALSLMVAPLLASCTSPPAATPVETETVPTAEPSGRGAGGTLRILNPEAPTILNPHLSGSVKDQEVCRITYEPLASFDKDGNLVPILAAEIPTLENEGVAADGRSVTWTLDQDAKWSDGQPFTADDVLFTYQFITNSEIGSRSTASYNAVESVEIIDLYTIKVNFKDVSPAWSVPFVGTRGAIIPRHIFEPYNGANAREAPANTLPVGTGPYRVMPPGIKPQEVLFLGATLVETNKIVFEPNPYFREADKPFFSRVEWRGGGTYNEAARLVLQVGDIDYAYQLGQLAYEELEKLATDGPGQPVIQFGSRVERIILNRTDPNQETSDGERSSSQFPHPFFSDKKVRQAFAYAIDREALAALFGPAGRATTNNLVTPPSYNSSNIFYEFDLEKARALLDEAGWVDTDGDGVRDKDGVEMQVVFQTPATHSQQFRQIVKDALNSVGVEVELKIVDNSIMFGSPLANPDCIRRFNADMQLFGRVSRSPDPDSYLQAWICLKIPQQDNNWTGGNYERWCSPEYDALYQQSTTELDPENRRQIFIQMNDMQIEDVVMIPVVYLANVQGVSRDIEGLDLTPWDTSTWNIKDWRRVSE